MLVGSEAKEWYIFPRSSAIRRSERDPRLGISIQRGIQWRATVNYENYNFMYDGNGSDTAPTRTLRLQMANKHNINIK